MSDDNAGDVIESEGRVLMRRNWVEGTVEIDFSGRRPTLYFAPDPDVEVDKLFECVNMLDRGADIFGSQVREGDDPSAGNPPPDEHVILMVRYNRGRDPDDPIVFGLAFPGDVARDADDRLGSLRPVHAAE